ncbi:hypothetical protein VitviT2T_019559 [Vitis vinifera]|uniref:Sodium/metabolite cotransporter BASS4, chloroplastic n=1 Tax=Vitis vinifera TaxID=29760 RepID=A0ABY9D3S1_VITVI|nr:hypothetical protein VitviT2T_019559 [Vitis vinifera]
MLSFSLQSGTSAGQERSGTLTNTYYRGVHGIILGFYSILLFTPLFSRLILQFQLQPQEFITGLPIFSCMLTTLSSGVALTQLAGGNSALALAMTVISNLLGILISLLQSYNFGAY